jgi:hypothetical protein
MRAHLEQRDEVRGLQQRQAGYVVHEPRDRWVL